MFIGSTANIVSQPVSIKTINSPNSKPPPYENSNLPPYENSKPPPYENSKPPPYENSKTLNTKRGGSHKRSKKQTGGSCCSPTFSLDGVEAQFPTIKGMSYAFYLFFAICFGGVFGSSMPSI
jgi:hypothetical protein